MPSVTVDGGVERRGMTPPLPRSIWLVAWGSLAGQVLLVVEHGGRVGDEGAQLFSMALAALLVGYVSAGVVRARRVRIALAWISLTLSLLGVLGEVVSASDLGEAAYEVPALVAALACVVGLARFHGSDWYAWQRTRPPVRAGASIAQLVVIGVLVGALGGYVGLVDEGVSVRINTRV